MSIVGWINRRERIGIRQGEATRILKLGEPSGLRMRRDLASVAVLSISTSGLLIETDEPIAMSEKIKVLFQDGLARESSVVWTGRSLHACRFQEPLANKAVAEYEYEASNTPSSVQQENYFRLMEKPPPESLGKRLRRIRLQRGMSLKRLASELGVSKPTLINWEKDRSFPRRVYVRELSVALRVSEHTLLYGEHHE